MHQVTCPPLPGKTPWKNPLIEKNGVALTQHMAGKRVQAELEQAELHQLQAQVRIQEQMRVRERLHQVQLRQPELVHLELPRQVQLQQLKTPNQWQLEQLQPPRQKNSDDNNNDSNRNQKLEKQRKMTQMPPLEQIQHNKVKEKTCHHLTDERLGHFTAAETLKEVEAAQDNSSQDQTDENQHPLSKT